MTTNGGCIFSGATVISCRGGNINFNGYFHLSNQCLIRSQYRINLYDRIFIGRGTVITDTDSHTIIIDGNKINNKKEVNIFNNVWIGMNCTILKGSTIGNDCMVAAGTLVVGKNVLDNSLVLNRRSIEVKAIDGWNL